MESWDSVAVVARWEFGGIAANSGSGRVED